MNINVTWRKKYLEYVYPLEESEKNLEKAKKILIKKAPNNLYKYRSGTLLDIENLKSNQAWFSSPIEFNDPYDSALFIDAEELLAIELNGLLKKANIERDINSSNIYNFYKLEGKIQHLKNVEELQLKFDNLINSLRIHSLSEENNNMLMWSHYSNYHKGFCIEYKFNDVLELFGYDFNPVAYIENLLNASEYIYRMSGTIAIRSALSKSIGWSYEKEWRIITQSNERNKGELVGMPTVNGIYLGCKIEEKLRKELIEICKMKKIDIYQMKLSKNDFKLESYKLKE